MFPFPAPSSPYHVLSRSFFYARSGANLKDPSRKPTINDPIERGRYYASRINAGNGALARALSTHPKVLIGAMNGPAVGISAAILGHCDLLYTSNDFYLFTPFTSIGLVAEGGTSLTFVRKVSPHLHLPVACSLLT